ASSHGGRWSIDTDRAPVRRSRGPETDVGYAEPIGAPNVVTVQRPSEQVNLLSGTPGFVSGDSRRFSFGIMNSVLGGGMSSRLFQEIRERRGLAYTAYSFGASYSDAGLFGMYAGTAPEKAAEVIDLAELELRKIADQGITEEEHERALGQLAG